MRNNVRNPPRINPFEESRIELLFFSTFFDGFLLSSKFFLAFHLFLRISNFGKKKKRNDPIFVPSILSPFLSFFPSFGKIRYEEAQRGISQDLERRLHSEQKSAEAVPRGKYEAEMDRVRNILQHNLRKERNCEKLEKLPKATQTNLPPPLSAISQSSVPKPMSVRQDSNVSSDSFSQTSSPSYTSKTMEAPLLPHKYSKVPGKEREVKYKILLMK